MLLNTQLQALLLSSAVCSGLAEPTLDTQTVLTQSESDVSFHPDNQTILTQSAVDLSFSTNQNYVEIGAYIEARDYFWAIWSRRGEKTCNETPYQLGHGCSISFECHGNIAWATTNGMSSALVDLVAKQAGIQEHTSRKQRVCTEPCERPQKGCCGWEVQDFWTTKISKTMEIYATNVDTNSDQGSLRYTLSCQKPENLICRLTKVLADSLSFAAPLMGPELAAVAKAFQVGSAMIKGGTDAGC